MRRPLAVLATASAALAIAAAPLACIDLFHTTDFDTLCTASPDDPACTSDGGGDGGRDGGATKDVDAQQIPDATRPHPEFCSWSSKEARTQAERACAWLGACEGPLGESQFGRCVLRAQLAFDCQATPSLRPVGAVDAFWSCLATAASCSEVDGCVFPRAVQECQPLEGGSFSACSRPSTGTVATRVECAGPTRRPRGVEPCVMKGQTCTEAEAASMAECTGTKRSTCTTSACSGTSAVACDSSSVDQGIDCAGYGTGACVNSVMGPSCAPGPAAGACGEDTAPTCEGAVVTMCAKGKKTHVNCEALGLPCDASEVPAHDLAAACVERGTGACSTSDTCAGSLLTSCHHGASFEVDCAALNLGDCTLVEVSGSKLAACTAPPK